MVRKYGNVLYKDAMVNFIAVRMRFKNFSTKRYKKLYLKGKATLKENIIKMKDILFPNILVQVS